MTARLIIALDLPTVGQALAIADRLGDACDFYKVGSELFTGAGPEAVSALVARGKEVFLDLKLHDIPNTVRGAARSASLMGARLLTVHATAGGDAVRAAVEGAGERCGVLAVTVLTSLDAAALAAAWGRPAVEVGEEVIRLAGVAREAGAHGVVCSGAEARAVRARYGDGLAILVPGLRQARAPAHDQARVATPAQAAAAGATYLVLGRMVTAAPDPADALETLRQSLA